MILYVVLLLGHLHLCAGASIEGQCAFQTNQYSSPFYIGVNGTGTNPEWAMTPIPYGLPLPASTSSVSSRCFSNCNSYYGYVPTMAPNTVPTTTGIFGYCSTEPWQVCGAGITCSGGGMCLPAKECPNDSFCCYCPAGKYLPSAPTASGVSTTGTTESSCKGCPKGSYSGGEYNNLFNWGCIACPPGYYADAVGSSACKKCDAGKTTFSSGSWYTSAYGYSGMSSSVSNIAIGATDKSQCVDIPQGTYNYPLNVMYSYPSSSGTYGSPANAVYYSSGISLAIVYKYPYYTTCQTYGKVLTAAQGTASSPNTDAECAACPANTPYYYAYGYGNANSIGMSSSSSFYTSSSGYSSSSISWNVFGAHFRSCGTTDTERAGYWWGCAVDSETEGTYSVSFYRDIKSPTCLDVCPAGTQADAINGGNLRICGICMANRGEYNPTVGGSCKVCPLTSYPESDTAVSCKTCPYPYITRSKEQTCRNGPSGNKICEVEWAGCLDPTDASMCLCLTTGAMLGIVLPITFGFILLMAFFVTVAIGFQPMDLLHRKSATPTGDVAQIELTEMAGKTTDFDFEKDGIKTKESEVLAVAPTTVPTSDDGDNSINKKDDGPFRDVEAEASELSGFRESTPEDPMGTGEARQKPVLIGWRVVVGLIAYTFVPFLDNMTDLAFLLSNPFYSRGLFIAFVVAYCGPGLGFAKMLIDQKAAPRFYIVPMPERFLWKEYNSLYKLITGYLILIPFVLLNSLFLGPWIMIGVLLYTTKAIAVKPVRNLWMHIWTGAVFAKPGTLLFEQRKRDFDDALYKPIDDKVLNESLTAHFLFETFPIVAIQFINNWSYGEWDGLAYFSIAFSLFNSISGIYRIFYYKVYLKVPLAAIPVDFQVYGMYVFGTEVSKNLLGDDVSDAERKHRFTITRTVHGDIVYTDDWVDVRGRARHDEIKQPLLMHFAHDVMELQTHVAELQSKVGIVSSSSTSSANVTAGTAGDH